MNYEFNRPPLSDWKCFYDALPVFKNPDNYIDKADMFGILTPVARIKDILWADAKLPA